MEEWRAIPDYEGLYEVSDQGNVRRIGPACPSTTPSRVGGGGTRPMRLLRPYRHENGICSIKLSRDALPRTHAIHRLVASAFPGSIAAREVMKVVSPGAVEVRGMDGAVVATIRALGPEGRL